MIATSAPGRPWDPRSLAQSTLFVAIVGASIADMLGMSFGFGAPLASALRWPAAGILFGLAAYRAGRVGGREILFAAAIVTLVVAGAELVDPAVNAFRNPPGGLLTPAIAAVFAFVAAVAATAMPSSALPGSPRIVHSAEHRATLLILVILGSLGVIFLLADVVGSAEVAQLHDGIQYVVSLVHSEWVAALGVGLVAWWWGSGWLLALGGLATIAAVPSIPADALTASVIASLLLGIGSVFAGLRPPGGGRSIMETLRSARCPIRSTPAAVWALAGSLLLVPTLLIGRFAPVSIECSAECPAISPLAGPSGYLDLAIVVFAPVAALALALAPTAGVVRDGRLAILGVVAAAFVLFQVVLGELDIRPFYFMGIAAPGALLVLIGFGAAAWRPVLLADVGETASFAIGLLAVIWISASFIGDFGLQWPSHVSAVVEAGIAAMALALAFAPRLPSGVLGDRLPG